MMNRQSRGNRLNTHELDRYLDEISKKPIHDKVMQHQFAILAKKGDERCKQALLESNLKLVVHIAKDYMGSADLMELVLAGNEALCKALEHYNPDKGCCFGTYASIWIRDAMLSSIEEQKRTVRIPRRAAQQLNKLKRGSSEGITPGRVDYINSINMQREEVDPTYEFQDTPEAIDTDDYALVKEILSIMPPLMSSYMNLAYGIDCNPLPIREIKSMLGLTRDSMTQLRRDSVTTFKKLWKRERAA